MNIDKKTLVLLAGVAGLMATGAQAHLFSVHANTQKTEDGEGSVINLAWGHALPMDDFLSGDQIATYELHAPGGAKHPLEFDKNANRPDRGAADLAGMRIQGGDAFVNKIAFKSDMPEGTYTVAASMNPRNFSVYIDDKGKKRWGAKTMDQFPNAKEFVISGHFQNYAKAYVTVGKWTEPKPVGHELEILPLVDLNSLKAGDVAKFKIVLKGEPVRTGDDGKPKLTAYGENFGHGDFSIQAGLDENGVASVLLPKPGRWLVYTSTVKPVGPDNRPDLVGKSLSAGNNASLSFVVKPQ